MAKRRSTKASARAGVGRSGGAVVRFDVWTIVACVVLWLLLVPMTVLLTVAGASKGWWLAPISVGLAIGASSRRPASINGLGAGLVGVSAALLVHFLLGTSVLQQRAGGLPQYLITDLSGQYLDTFTKALFIDGVGRISATTLTVSMTALLAASAYLAPNLVRRFRGSAVRPILASATLVSVCALVWLGGLQPTVLEPMRAPQKSVQSDVDWYAMAFQNMEHGQGYYDAFIAAAELDSRVTSVRDGKFVRGVTTPAQWRLPWIFWLWRYLAPGGAIGVVMLAITFATGLLVLLYLGLRAKLGEYALFVPLCTAPLLQSMAMPQGVFLAESWAGMFCLAALVAWMAGWRKSALAVALAAALCREVALILVVVLIGVLLFELVSRRRADYASLIFAVGVIAVFSLAFAVHSRVTSTRIVSARGGSSVAVSMLSHAASSGFTRKFVAPGSFLGVVPWLLRIPPVAFLVLQFPGWIGAFWKDVDVWIAPVAYGAFWMIFTAIVGASSSYWGLLYVPVAYAGTGAAIAAVARRASEGSAA